MYVIMSLSLFVSQCISKETDRSLKDEVVPGSYVAIYIVIQLVY